MALRFIDGFDTYPSADAPLKWTSQSGSVATVSGGRFGGNCLQIGGSNYLYKTIDNQSTWIVGCAFKMVVSGALPIIVGFYDNGTLQCDLRVNGSGNLFFTRNSTSLGVSTPAISLNTWYYVETKVLINASTGTVDVKVNNASWLSLTGQNTKTTSNSTANQILLGGTGQNQSNSLWDDLYVCDSSGSVNNTFLGDVRVEALKPSGAGNYTQFTHNGASQNYNCVNEASDDGDTTYNSDATTGHIDTFTFPAMSSTPNSVMGVQTSLVARKDDAGSHTTAALFRAGGTDYAQTAQAVSSSYLYLLTLNETNPATSAAWTASDINAIEAGYKLVS